MSDLLRDRTNKALVAMSVPISLGMLSTFLFQVIDTYFVGKLGASALAALSFSSTLYFILVGLFVGLSVGVSVMVGQAFGAGNLTRVRHVTFTAQWLTLLIAGAISAVSLLLLNPIFSFLGADEEVLPLIREYTVPILLGMPLLALGLVSGAVVRASGKVAPPEIIMALAGGINLVFDYGLIFGEWGLPELGIRGAAYATVLSWAFVFVAMTLLMFRKKLVSLARSAQSKTESIPVQLLRLGAPTVLTQTIGPFTLMFLTFLLARESSMAVAAFGVAGRIEMLLMIGILGISTAITPFIAQNFGARKKERIDEAVAFGGRASTYMGALIAVILYLFISPIAALFSESKSIIETTSLYFYLVAPSYLFYGLYIITTSIFNGLQLTGKSLRITLVKTLAFTVPFALVGSFFGVKGVFLGVALSNVFGGIYAAYEMRKDLKRAGSSLAKVHVGKEYLKDFSRLRNLFVK